MLKCLECPCSDKNYKNHTGVYIRMWFLTYLGSIIDMKGGLDEDVIQRREELKPVGWNGEVL